MGCAATRRSAIFAGRGPARRAGSIELVTVVWVLLAVVVLVSCYFLLQVVEQLSKTMGALVASMEELGEVAADLKRLKGEVQGDGRRGAGAERLRGRHQSPIATPVD